MLKHFMDEPGVTAFFLGMWKRRALLCLCLNCVVLDKLLHLFMPQFSHLQNGGDDNTRLKGLCKIKALKIVPGTR